MNFHLANPVVHHATVYHTQGLIWSGFVGPGRPAVGQWPGLEAQLFVQKIIKRFTFIFG